MASTQLLVSAELVDSTVAANTWFPTIQTYEDGQVLALMLGACLAGAALLIYCTGTCGRCVAGLDAFTTVRVPVNRGGEQALVPRVSKFGGALTLACLCVALGVVADVLISYAREYGVDAASTTLPLTRAASGANTVMGISLVAQLLQPSAPCAVIGASIVQPSGGQQELQADFRVTRTSRFRVNDTAAVTLSNSSNILDTLPVGMYCNIQLVAQNFAVAAPYFAGPRPSNQLPPRIELTLPAGVHLVHWTMSMKDARPDTATSGKLVSAVVSSNFNCTNSSALSECPSRSFEVQLRLLEAHYRDTSFYSAGVQVQRSGYRPSFTSASVQDTSLPVSLAGDQLLVSIERDDYVLRIERTPRLTILQLLGVLGGLTVTVFAAFKYTYELAETLCGCSRLVNPCRPHRSAKSKVLSSAGVNELQAFEQSLANRPQPQQQHSGFPPLSRTTLGASARRVMAPPIPRPTPAFAAVHMRIPSMRLVPYAAPEKSPSSILSSKPTSLPDEADAPDTSTLSPLHAQEQRTESNSGKAGQPAAQSSSSAAGRGILSPGQLSAARTVHWRAP